MSTRLLYYYYYFFFPLLLFVKKLTICSFIGEPGICVGKINSKQTISTFLGYADKVESEKKILKNVFKKGDNYFNSGDILVMDDYGYFSFKDRTGDTFR